MPPPSQREPISVVMPVHNALPHLDAAVSSILDQSFSNIEFVIYDDASTDGSTERLREWALKDSRIRLFEGVLNLGPALSSNHVVEKASSQLIARMDADDVSHPDRLLRQVELLRDRPDVGVVATLCEIIDASGKKLRDPEVWRLARKSWFVPFAHGSMMFRRNVFDQVGGYRKECEYWEDQDLVVRMSFRTKILVIPSSLFQVRQSTSSTRITSDRDRVERAVDLMYRSLKRLSENRTYEDLLRAESGKDRRIDPMVFISRGSLELWAGGKPRLLSRLLRRGDLKFNFRTLSAIVWTGWAALSPSSLRAFLSMILRARNWFADTGISENTPIDWSPPKTDLLRTLEEQGT
jgi:glycosyltransferase involved in cell wall biosynthesis